MPSLSLNETLIDGKFSKVYDGVTFMLHILGFFKLWKIWEILWGHIGQVFVEFFGWVGCDSDKFALKAFPFII